MKMLKNKIAFVGIILAASVAAAVAWRQTEHRPFVALQSQKVPATPAQPSMNGRQEKLTLDQPLAQDSPPPQKSKVALPPVVPSAAKPPLAQTKPKSAPKPKDPIQDPMAREALGYVGLDPLAEQYWVSAINDPTLPPDERRELIEDLNQDGFPDPRHLSESDVPMILSRLQLIEDLAPDALDQVNDAAFQEAYKDLVNMLAKTP